MEVCYCKKLKLILLVLFSSLVALILNTNILAKTSYTYKEIPAVYIPQEEATGSNKIAPEYMMKSSDVYFAGGGAICEYELVSHNYSTFKGIEDNKIIIGKYFKATITDNTKFYYNNENVSKDIFLEKITNGDFLQYKGGYTDSEYFATEVYGYDFVFPQGDDTRTFNTYHYIISIQNTNYFPVKSFEDSCGNIITAIDGDFTMEKTNTRADERTFLKALEKANIHTWKTNTSIVGNVVTGTGGMTDFNPYRCIFTGKGSSEKHYIYADGSGDSSYDGDSSTLSVVTSHNYFSGYNSITFGEGITYIGAQMFWPVDRNWDSNGMSVPYRESTKAPVLKTISFSTTVKEIGDGAFRATKIETVPIPANLDRIGNSAFASRYAAEHEDDGDYYGDHAPTVEADFRNGKGINAKIIGINAFFLDEYATFDDGILAEGVERVENNAFDAISLLKEDSSKALNSDNFGWLYLPSTIEYVGDCAFNQMALNKILSMPITEGLELHTDNMRGVYDSFGAVMANGSRFWKLIEAYKRYAPETSFSAVIRKEGFVGDGVVYGRRDDPGTSTGGKNGGATLKWNTVTIFKTPSAQETLYATYPAYKDYYYNWQIWEDIDNTGPNIKATQTKIGNEINVKIKNEINSDLGACDVDNEGTTKNAVGLPLEPYSYDNGLTWVADPTHNYDTNGLKYIYVKDLLGNMNSTMAYITGLDTQKPVIESITPASKSKTIKTISIVATDDIALKSIKVTAKSSANPPITKTYTLTPDGKGNASFDLNIANFNNYYGEYNITAVAYDTVGNTSDPVTASVFISNNVLSYDLTQSPVEPTEGDVTISIINVSLPSSSLPAAPYSFDGGVSYKSRNSLTVSENGTYTVCVKDIDGNVVTKKITISNIAIPEGCTVTPNPEEYTFYTLEKNSSVDLDVGNGIIQNNICHVHQNADLSKMQATPFSLKGGTLYYTASNSTKKQTGIGKYSLSGKKLSVQLDKYGTYTFDLTVTYNLTVTGSSEKIPLTATIPVTIIYMNPNSTEYNVTSVLKYEDTTSSKTYTTTLEHMFEESGYMFSDSSVNVTGEVTPLYLLGSSSSNYKVNGDTLTVTMNSYNETGTVYYLLSCTIDGKEKEILASIDCDISLVEDTADDTCQYVFNTKDLGEINLATDSVSVTLTEAMNNITRTNNISTCPAHSTETPELVGESISNATITYSPYETLDTISDFTEPLTVSNNGQIVYNGKEGYYGEYTINFDTNFRAVSTNHMFKYSLPSEITFIYNPAECTVMPLTPNALTVTAQYNDSDIVDGEVVHNSATIDLSVLSASIIPAVYRTDLTEKVSFGIDDTVYLKGVSLFYDADCKSPIPDKNFKWNGNKLILTDLVDDFYINYSIVDSHTDVSGLPLETIFKSGETAGYPNIHVSVDYPEDTYIVELTSYNHNVFNLLIQSTIFNKFNTKISYIDPFSTSQTKYNVVTDTHTVPNMTVGAYTYTPEWQIEHRPYAPSKALTGRIGDEITLSWQNNGDTVLPLSIACTGSLNGSKDTSTRNLYYTVPKGDTYCKVELQTGGLTYATYDNQTGEKLVVHMDDIKPNTVMIVTTYNDCGGESPKLIYSIPNSILYNSSTVDKEYTVYAGDVVTIEKMTADDIHDSYYAIPAVDKVVSSSNLGTLKYDDKTDTVTYRTASSEAKKDVVLTYTYKPVATGITPLKGKITIHVRAANTPPVANADNLTRGQVTVNQNVPTTISSNLLLANDTDDYTPAAKLEVAEVYDGFGITASLSEDKSTIAITPNKNFTGVAHFKYKAKDEDGLTSNEAQVTVKVNRTDYEITIKDVDTKIGYHSGQTVEIPIDITNKSNYIFTPVEPLKIYTDNKLISNGSLSAYVKASETTSNKAVIVLNVANIEDYDITTAFRIPFSVKYTYFDESITADSNIYIKFEGNQSDILEGYLYVHRKPIADFSVSVAKDATSVISDVSIDEFSYDYDHNISSKGKWGEVKNLHRDGVHTWEWSWRCTGENAPSTEWYTSYNGTSFTGEAARSTSSAMTTTTLIGAYSTPVNSLISALKNSPNGINNAQFKLGKYDIEVRLRVRDIDAEDYHSANSVAGDFGEWSDYKIVTITNKPEPPIALFNFNSDIYTLPKSGVDDFELYVTDRSYDPNGDAITKWTWTLYDGDGNQVMEKIYAGVGNYNENTWSNELKSQIYNKTWNPDYDPAAPTFTLKLQVQDATGLDSNVYTRTITVYRENLPPGGKEEEKDPDPVPTPDPTPDPYDPDKPPISPDPLAPSLKIDSQTRYEVDDAQDGVKGDDYGEVYGYIDWTKFKFSDDQGTGPLTVNWDFEGQHIDTREDYSDYAGSTAAYIHIYNNLKVNPDGTPVPPFTSNVTTAGWLPGAYKLSVSVTDNPTGVLYGNAKPLTTVIETLSNNKPHHFYVVPKLYGVPYITYNGWIFTKAKQADGTWKNVQYKESDGTTPEQNGLTLEDILPEEGDDAVAHVKTNQYVIDMFSYVDIDGETDVKGNVYYDSAHDIEVDFVRSDEPDADGFYDWTAPLPVGDIINADGPTKYRGDVVPANNVLDLNGFMMVHHLRTNWGHYTGGPEYTRFKTVAGVYPMSSYKLYDFRVTDVTDPTVSKQFREYVESLPEFAELGGVVVGHLAVDYNSNIAGANADLIRKGYGFYFALHSKGFAKDGDYIEIIPKFYEINRDPLTNTISIGNQLAGYVPDENGQFKEYTNISSDTHLKEMYELFYDSARTVSIGTHDLLNLPSALRTIYDNYQMWRGRYGIPADAKFYPYGSSPTATNVYKGEILITFEIIGYHNGVARYNYIDRGQWEKERALVLDGKKTAYASKETEWKTASNFVGSVIVYSPSSIHDIYVPAPVWNE